VKLAGEHLEHVVGAEQADQPAAAVDHRQPAHALGAHQGECAPEAVGFARAHHFGRHHAVERALLRIEPDGHHADRDIAVGDDSGRHAPPAALIDHYHRADMALAHQARGERHALGSFREYHLTAA
jgi:hypothetical protein